MDYDNNDLGYVLCLDTKFATRTHAYLVALIQTSQPFPLIASCHDTYTLHRETHSLVHGSPLQRRISIQLVQHIALLIIVRRENNIDDDVFDNLCLVSLTSAWDVSRPRRNNSH